MGILFTIAIWLMDFRAEENAKMKAGQRQMGELWRNEGTAYFESHVGHQAPKFPGTLVDDPAGVGLM